MSFKPLSRDSGYNILLPTKSKRSQSALEYMMTYGWAILIIVIVAVILYSMGIFNPSSSISTTITGFSSTPVSAAIFTNNGGLSLSVENSVGYPIEITNITATSATGGKVTILPNITLLPGKSQVLVFSKIFTAANQGSHISTAVTITYKEISQPLPGPYISTGSITGSTPSVVYPSNYTFAAVSKLTITNSQSSATPSPFQQMVNITSADNGFQLISPDFGQNVEFFYSNGTVIPSWLESYSSSNAIWWLKIGSIPASSSITVYMGIAPTSTNLFNNVNDGEAPQIPCIEEGVTNTSKCSVYAEYDDGVNVFNNYWNFAGISLPSGWIVSGSGSITVNNGVLLSYNGQGPFVEGPVQISSGTILDALVSAPSNGEINIGGFNSYISDLGFTGPPAIWAIGPTSGGSVTGWLSYSNTPMTSANVQNVLTFYYVSGSMTLLANYQKVTSISSTFSSSQYISFNGYGNSGAGKGFIQWLRTRAYPPNGVMPSISFSSVA